MRLMQELFSTDVGLLSIAGIAFMLGMGVFYLRYFLGHMAQDEQREAAARR
ncbi:MAG: DUF3149 domain-containing protein [Burkholderiales bacterium]|uniref:DUF3149 domain-containing protein n=1 Tax=Inhella sp. TaxID=1921806 RepID=UPI001AC1BF15|nr:DUF3149 domain-containing protein [Burkholderiales bacterium]